MACARCDGGVWCTGGCVWGMVVLLAARPAGAGGGVSKLACGTSGHSPFPSHHPQKAPAAPANHMDCGHDMPGMVTCVMSCCHDSDRSLFTSIAFVLPPPLASAAVAFI